MSASAQSPPVETPPVTAAVLVIGDEILSGRTQDTNVNTIARFLGERGIDLEEVRFIRDVHEEIVDGVNALRSRYDYLITTGGIGPTHDDITADGVAAAFGVPLLEDAQIIAEMTVRYGEAPNAARRRMARIPQGGSKVRNPVSGPPGFQIGNVFVLAGVPRIMAGMLEDVGPRLRQGAVVISRTVRVEGTGEGVLAAPLKAVAGAFPQLMMGSYPFQIASGFGSNLVIRGRDPALVDQGVQALMQAFAAAGVQGARLEPAA